MSDTVLPKLPADDIAAQLPADPAELLSLDEKEQLQDYLARLVRLRRDAETASGSLRLA